MKRRQEPPRPIWTYLIAVIVAYSIGFVGYIGLPMLVRGPLLAPYMGWLLPVGAEMANAVFGLGVMFGVLIMGYDHDGAGMVMLIYGPLSVPVTMLPSHLYASARSAKSKRLAALLQLLVLAFGSLAVHAAFSERGAEFIRQIRAAWG